MNESSNPIVWICCSVLEAEVRVLHQQYWPKTIVHYPSSMLHMEPEKLSGYLEELVDSELQQGHRIVLIYGDCCSWITSLQARPGVVRVSGKNCYEILLGRQRYRELARQGVFFLLVEWILRWPEVFQHRLGLNRANASAMMQDVHRKLIYLDTGILPIPHKEINDCSRYCGLPAETMPVSLEPLRMTMEECMVQLKNQKALI